MRDLQFSMSQRLYFPIHHITIALLQVTLQLYERYSRRSADDRLERTQQLSDDLITRVLIVLNNHLWTWKDFDPEIMEPLKGVIRHKHITRMRDSMNIDRRADENWGRYLDCLVRERSESGRPRPLEVLPIELPQEGTDTEETLLNILKRLLVVCQYTAIKLHNTPGQRINDPWAGKLRVEIQGNLIACLYIALTQSNSGRQFPDVLYLIGSHSRTSPSPIINFLTLAKNQCLDLGQWKDDMEGALIKLVMGLGGHRDGWPAQVTRYFGVQRLRQVARQKWNKLARAGDMVVPGEDPMGYAWQLFQLCYSGDKVTHDELIVALNSGGTPTEPAPKLFSLDEE